MLVARVSVCVLVPPEFPLRVELGLSKKLLEMFHFKVPGWNLCHTPPHMAVEKGKVYENESQIPNTHTHTHVHVASSPSLALCQEAICLGKPKGDLACRLHWKSNEHSNDGHSLEAIFVL